LGGHPQEFRVFGNSHCEAEIKWGAIWIDRAGVVTKALGCFVDR